jgi:hypothetical protein
VDARTVENNVISAAFWLSANVTSTCFSVPENSGNILEIQVTASETVVIGFSGDTWVCVLVELRGFQLGRQCRKAAWGPERTATYEPCFAA